MRMFYGLLLVGFLAFAFRAGYAALYLALYGGTVDPRVSIVTVVFTPESALASLVASLVAVAWFGSALMATSRLRAPIDGGHEAI